MSLVRPFTRKVVPIGVRLFATEPPKVNTTPPKPASAPIPTAKDPVVGPGASKQGPYKNPEYYTYNVMSHYDIEKDMEPFRIPQPSSLKK